MRDVAIVTFVCVRIDCNHKV